MNERLYLKVYKALLRGASNPFVSPQWAKYLINVPVQSYEHERCAFIMLTNCSRRGSSIQLIAGKYRRDDGSPTDGMELLKNW